MDDNQVFHPNLKKTECFFYCFPTPIHKGQGFGEDDFLRIDPTRSEEHLEPLSGIDNGV
jgi:hypothetical protein